MMSIYEEVFKKYSFLLNDNGSISLQKIGDYLHIAKNINSIDLKTLGLTDFNEDLKWICGDINAFRDYKNKYRKYKLQKINNHNHETS